VWSPTVPYDPANDDPDSPTFGQTFPRHPVPAAFADLLNSRPVPDAPWTYVGGLDYLPNFTTETTSNVYQVIAGVEGDAKVGSHDWNWEMFASQGKTTVNARQPEGFPFLPRLQNLFNADMYGKNFDVLSLPGAVPLAVTGTCETGLPIFNEDGSVNNRPSVSQDCADYVVLRMNNITELTQDVMEANVTGSLANMPAGELQFALGVSHREENFSYDPDTGYNANQDYPVVIQNIILPVAVNGRTKVDELYGELAIPLVRGKKFAQSLEIDPGYRFSDYNTVGSEETYKIMGHWEINDRVRFRGGYQLATRAPNVTELFTPIGGSALFFGGVTDACAYYPSATQPWGNRPENQNRLNLQIACQYLMTREGAPATLYEPGAASANTYDYNVFGGRFYFPATIGVTEGNRNLLSESADTYTAGIVLSFERVTLSVDWYDIELENAIGIPSHDTIYQQCLDPTYNPLIGDAAGSHTGAELIAGNPFCNLIQREYVGGAPLTPGNYGADRKYSAQYINQGGIKSEGFDVQLDWGFDVGQGAMNFSVVASFLDTYSESPFPGADFIDYTGTLQNSSFDYQTFTTVRYQGGSWGLGVRWQHLPSIDPAPSSATDVRGVKSHDQFDLFANWNINRRFSLRAGIDNLLDEDPEIVGATSFNNARGSTNSNYDQFGRRYFIGLNVSM
jgi:iron complex outermembrane receptor protein